jgi:hypothetical protein
MNARDIPLTELQGPPVDPRWAAERFAKPIVRKGYEFIALHTYSDRAGAPLYWRLRAKHPDTGEKWVRPMCREGIDYALREPKFTGGKPLYRLDVITNGDFASPVWFVEGEGKVDALIARRLAATTSGSASSDDKAGFEPLRGRRVIMWPDNDTPGRDHMQRVAVTLQAMGCMVQIVNIDALALPEHGDVIDYLAIHPDTTAVDLMALPMIEPPGNDMTADTSANDEADVQRESQASALVAFVEGCATLFHDQNADVYAQDLATLETRRLEGRQFRDWLVASFYSTTGKAPRDQSVREALSTLAGLGRFHGDCMPVHVRVAQHDGAYFLDLAEPGTSRAIKIEPGRWEVVSDPPVRFVRSETMRPLPEPRSGGDLSALWPLVNIPEESRLLVLAWLGECLRPDTPFPILELIGEQGSAKSTTQTVLRRLIDPNACDLRAAPKTVEDVFVSAGVSWLVSYENISYLSAPMQDALCVLATGGGFATRRFYTNTDESVITVKRPIVLNGISIAVTAQDLIDRTLSVEMPVIRERTEVTDLWTQFGAEHGRLLGAVLDIVANALQRLPRQHLAPEDRPRLIEFAHFGMAIAQAIGKTGQDFMTEFTASRQESIARTIDASPVASALIDWFEARDRRAAELTVKALFQEIETRKPPNTDAWPRSTKGFGDALRRVAPALRQLGIECRSLGKTGGNVKWRIESKEIRANPSPASPDVLVETGNPASRPGPGRTLGHSGHESSSIPPASGEGDTVEVTI